MGLFCIFLIVNLLYLVGARLFNLVSIEIRISIDTKLKSLAPTRYNKLTIRNIQNKPILI